uniref:Uncharacterized protein n=1 Tax=Ananas comosus var. bracteatus TaxID=296719 RepID=A0A6V7NGG3_ANACO|nr:unnamed protein product [Ananas comosus var. bracteatus]
MPLRIKAAAIAPKPFDCRAIADGQKKSEKEAKQEPLVYPPSDNPTPTSSPSLRYVSTSQCLRISSSSSSRCSSPSPPSEMSSCTPAFGSGSGGANGGGANMSLKRHSGDRG